MQKVGEDSRFLWIVIGKRCIPEGRGKKQWETVEILYVSVYALKDTRLEFIQKNGWHAFWQDCCNG